MKGYILAKSRALDARRALEPHPRGSLPTGEGRGGA